MEQLLREFERAYFLEYHRRLPHPLQMTGVPDSLPPSSLGLECQPAYPITILLIFSAILNLRFFRKLSWDNVIKRIPQHLTCSKRNSLRWTISVVSRDFSNSDNIEDGISCLSMPNMQPDPTLQIIHTTLPNMVYLLSRSSHLSRVMKNCELFVSGSF